MKIKKKRPGILVIVSTIESRYWNKKLPTAVLAKIELFKIALKSHQVFGLFC